MADQVVTTPQGIGALLMAGEAERRQAVEDAVVEAALAGSAVISMRCPKIWRGHLRQSIHVEKLEHGAQILIDAPYAGVIEAGARPHFPPIGPLIDWVKGHIGSFGIKKPRVSKKLPTDPKRLFKALLRRVAKLVDFEKEVSSVAYAIQRKIGKHGSPPTWWVKNSLPQLGRILGALVKEALKK